MKPFVEYIIKNLVEQPNAVDVRCFEGERGVMVEVRVAAQDVGKVVGRRGNTINALRTIATMACARLGRRVRIELIETEAAPSKVEESQAEESQVQESEAQVAVAEE